MPARHKANPFWAQAVKRKEKLDYVHWFCMRIYLTSGKRRKNLQKTQSSDGGILLPPAMVPNLCIDRKLGFDSPRCAVSFPRIGIGQMDSKQEFFAPSDVQVNLQCAMLISSAAYTHSMTKVSIQLFVRRYVLQWWRISCHSRDQSVSDGGVTTHRQCFRKRTSSAQSCFLYRVR